MQPIKVNRKNTKIIAHRGLSAIETENTVQSFELAAQHNYFAIECDIMPSRDKHLIISHDRTTERLTGKKLKIGKLTKEQIMQLKMINTNSNRNSDNVTYCTFEQYLKICKKHNKVAVVEFKDLFSNKNIKKAIAQCKKEHSLDKVIFISFRYTNLIKVRKILPNQNIQFLVEKYKERKFKKFKRYNFGLDTEYNQLSKDVVQKFHKHGLEVNCYTVDSKEAASKLVEMGVDYITTNILV